MIRDDTYSALLILFIGAGSLVYQFQETKPRIQSFHSAYDLAALTEESET